MKELIKKYLKEQVIDRVGETRPYIDPDFIDVYADDIEKLVKNNAVLPHVSDNEVSVCDNYNPEIAFPTDNGKCKNCGKYHE